MECVLIYLLENANKEKRKKTPNLPWDIIILIIEKTLKKNRNFEEDKEKDKEEKRIIRKVLYESHRRFHRIPEVKNYGIEKFYKYLVKTFFSSCINFNKFTKVIYKGKLYQAVIYKNLRHYPNPEFIRVTFGSGIREDESYYLRIYKEEKEEKYNIEFKYSSRILKIKSIKYVEKDNCFYIT